MAARSPTSSLPRMALNPLESLPAEIFLEVSNYLASRADVLQLSQVVRSNRTSPKPCRTSDSPLHVTLRSPRQSMARFSPPSTPTLTSTAQSNASAHSP